MIGEINAYSSPDLLSKMVKPCPFCGGEMMVNMSDIVVENGQDGVSLTIFHKKKSDCLPALVASYSVGEVSQILNIWNRRVESK